MKYEKLIITVMILVLYCFIPQTRVMASENSFSVEVLGEDKYAYKFDLLEASEVSINIVDEGDSVVNAFLETDNGDKKALVLDSKNNIKLSLDPGVYILWIENSNDFEAYYDIVIDSDSIIKEVSTIKFAAPYGDLKIGTAVVDGETVQTLNVDVDSAFDIEVVDSNGNTLNNAKLTLNNKKVLKDRFEDGDYHSLTAIKAGECIMTATYKGATVKLYIQVGEVVYALKKSSYKIRYNKTINVDFLKDDKTAYPTITKVATSNKKVAVWDKEEEVIVTKGEGRATITFTISSGQKLECKVTVPKLSLLENINSQAAYSSDLSQIYTEVINKIKYPYASVFICNRLKDTKMITYVEYSVYQYDNKGSRVNASDSDFTWNDNIYGGSTINVYTSANVKKYHSCVKKVYYDDDTTWSNPYYKEWATKYKSKY